jgi:hypothetical protein
MSTQYRIDKDLNEAVKMANVLEDYVRGDQLYASLSGGWYGGGDAPALTAGALAMRLRRLDMLKDKLSAARQQELAAAQDKQRQVQREWSVHYEAKLLKEVQSRLDAMKTFFKEVADNPALAAHIYLPEVLRRTIVQELVRMMDGLRIESAEVMQKLREVDSTLRGVVVAGKFQWDAQLQPVYPIEEFWWLYRAPLAQDDRK